MGIELKVGKGREKTYVLGDIKDGGSSVGLSLEVSVSGFREERPQFVHIDVGSVVEVGLLVENPHSDLSEVSRMA